jgi:hypothetical protein
MDNRAYCTVEYLDENGDPVIKHMMLSESDKNELIEQFIQRGVVATIYQHGQSVKPAVLSGDDKPRLEVSTDSRIK